MTDAPMSILRSRPLRMVRMKVTAFVRAFDRLLSIPEWWFGACLALLAFQILLIFMHQPWLDEYQAIQLAVQAPDIHALLGWLSYEGHPPLWYLILRGLSYLVEPLLALRLAAAMCAIILLVALLTASPFTRAERILIACSEFVLFEFLTVSRSLSLGAALVVLAMAVWKRRGFWLVVALLPMCDLLFGVLSVALVAIKWRERSLWWPGVALWLAIGLAAAWSVMPAPDIQPALQSERPGLELIFWCVSMSTLAFPFQGFTWPQWNEPPNAVVAMWAWIVFIWFVWVRTSKEPFYRALLMGFMLFTLVFSVAVYRLSNRHLMLTALFFIILTWLLRSRGERPSAAFRVWLVVVAGCGLLTAGINLVVPFDTAKQAAARIRQLGLAKKHWMVFPDSRGAGVSAINNMMFERDGMRCMQTFVRWNHYTPKITRDFVENYFSYEIKSRGRFYLISTIDFGDFPKNMFKLIAQLPPGYNGYPYYLYIVGPHANEKNISLPKCVPDQRPFTKLS